MVPAVSFSAGCERELSRFDTGSGGGNIIRSIFRGLVVECFAIGWRGDLEKGPKI
jgi:hypothetical protein